MQYRTYYHCLTPYCSAHYVLVELSRKPRLTKYNTHAVHCTALK